MSDIAPDPRSPEELADHLLAHGWDFRPIPGQYVGQAKADHRNMHHKDDCGHTHESLVAEAQAFAAMLSRENDLRLVCLAAMAWLHEHDYPGEHADGMDAEIDPGELAAAVDRLTGRQP